MDPDELYALRNQFWLGNYKLAISEGLSLKPATDKLKIDKEVFINRCYIAMGEYSKVISGIPEQAPTALQAVKLLATYLSQPGQKDMILMTLNDWLNDPNSSEDNTLKLIAGIIYLNQGEMKGALKTLSSNPTLEMMALTIQIYLKMQRIDLAERQLENMQDTDDDSPLTQLAQTWVYLFMGKEKYQEAAYNYQELADKSGTSSILLNGLAAANIRLGKYDDALKQLQKAIKIEGGLDGLAETPTVTELLTNLLVCATHLRKKALVEDCLGRLAKRSAVPGNPLSSSLDVLKNAQLI